MIGYGRGKIILKFPPFCRLNEELQEREIQNINWKQKQKRFWFHLMFWIFLLLIFLIQSAERREFQNNFSSSVPYHIQPWLKAWKICPEFEVTFIHSWGRLAGYLCLFQISERAPLLGYKFFFTWWCLIECSPGLDLPLDSWFCRTKNGALEGGQL